MIKKIIRIGVSILIAILPFFSAALMASFSPYIEGNSIGIYILVSLANVFVSTLILAIVWNRQLPTWLFVAAIMFFLMGTVMASIFGLGVPPEISPVMLQHPEREHYRYAILFLNALFFAGAFLAMVKAKSSALSKWNLWFLLLLIPSLAEMIWEFYHHYHYAESLQVWLDQGNEAAGFIESYDSISIVRIGAIGRIFQFSCIALLAFVLQRNQYIRKGSMFFLVAFCMIAMVAAIFIFSNGFHFPKGFEFIFMFFIPGVPFLILYWIGVALMTKPPSVQESLHFKNTA